MYDPARDIFKSEDHVPAEEDGRKEPVTSHEVTSAKEDRDREAANSSKGAGSVEETKPASAMKETKSERRPQSTERTSRGQEVSTTTPSEKMKKRRRSPSPVEEKRASPSEKTMGDKALAQPKNGTEAEKDDQLPSASKKRRKSSPVEAERPSPQFPAPMPLDKLPRFSRKKRDVEDQPKPRISRREGRERSRSPRSRRRARSPDRDRHRDSRDERRSPPRQRIRSRSPLRRPSPPPRRFRSRSPLRRPSPPARSPSRSPPRKLKRPGGASRITAAEKDALRKRQQERQEEQMRQAQREAAMRGTQDVVREHYNAVPERGREWRKTDSMIRGLRSFNNWIKSTIIQKFSPMEGHRPGDESAAKWAEGMDGGGLDADHRRGLLVLDIGCGKGGDLGKWQQAYQPVELYVGIDPADVSIEQARARYRQMRHGGHRGNDRRPPPPGVRGPRDFHAEFFVRDAFSTWLGDIPIIREVGIDDAVGSRWGGGGFDVVSMMFCMHYAFESEAKARGMLRNVAGSLKKGGRFLGVIPNSDVLTQKVIEYHRRRRGSTGNEIAGAKRDAEGNVKEMSGESTSHEMAGSKRDVEGKVKEKPKEEEEEEEGEVGATKEESKLEWGNRIYRVQFPGDLPKDGIFRPPFGWKYQYFLEEAVEGVPEYVVPWEAFRALTEEYNLELQYRRPFPEIWNEEKDDPILGPLSERMGVRGRDRGPLLVKDEEMEAASEYQP
ncbi:MAG: cell cycle RNA binding protein whi3 [Watsoniomyces obsoletus]|nr:MAG: cell cycle RNA binding protein whi3 [Watsoniomyces obsoletus]